MSYFCNITKLCINTLSQVAQFGGRICWTLVSAVGKYREETRRALRHRVQITWLLESVYNHSQANHSKYKEHARVLPNIWRTVCQGSKESSELSI